MKKNHLLLLLGTSLATASAASAAALAAGDVIAVNFTAGANVTNWNNIGSGATSFAAGTVVDWNDGSTIDAVTINQAYNNPTLPGFAANVGASWVGISSDPYFNSNAGTLDDIMYTSGNGAISVDTATYTIAGLDSSLIYNVRVYSVGVAGTQETTFSVNGGTPFTDTRTSITNSSEPILFSGLTGITSIELLLSSDDANNYMNGFVIEAVSVPEPSSFALIAGFLGLASVMILRRR